MELGNRLAEIINHLINSDFSRLVGILYRVDVSEQKLKSLLKQYPDAAAGSIIASLILERQEQKIESKKQFGSSTTESDEERW